MYLYRLNGHEFEQAPGEGEGQGSLACCSSWGCRVGLDWATEQKHIFIYFSISLFTHWVLNMPVF